MAPEENCLIIATLKKTRYKEYRIKLLLKFIDKNNIPREIAENTGYAIPFNPANSVASLVHRNHLVASNNFITTGRCTSFIYYDGGNFSL